MECKVTRQSTSFCVAILAVLASCLGGGCGFQESPALVSTVQADRPASTPASDEPSTPASDEPGTPASDEPGLPASDEPSTPAGDEPSTPAGGEPSTPAGGEPSTPAGDEPELLQVADDATPLADAPPTALAAVFFEAEDSEELQVAPAFFAENIPAPQESPESPASAKSESLADDRQVASGKPLEVYSWPKPEVLFFVTGRQTGYIEPCGCSGLENAKGGLSRRDTLLKDLRSRFEHVVPIDVGNQVRRFGRQAELKFQATIDSLYIMDYQAIGFGPDDLRLSTGDLVSAVAGADPDKTPFVCANANLLGLTPKYRIVTVGKRKIGITAVLGKEHLRNLNSDEIETSDPVTALREVIDLFRKEDCELYVLLAHASLAETRELVRTFPEIQIVITGGGAGEPTEEPERVPGCHAYIVQVGTKGMYVGALGVFLDPQRPVRYERIPLDARFQDSQPMLERFAAYQNDLKQLGFAGLGVRAVAHPYDEGRSYVGHETCADCHTQASAVFEETTHAHATISIAKPTQRSEIPRIYDPECVSCHVTGWDPQGYVPYKSGYVDFTQSMHLYSNGCENCHGPGSRHVAAETGDIDVSEAEIEKFRAEMRLTLEEAKKSKCFECHDLDNSPEFQLEGAFEEYWEAVKHEGKD